MKISRISALFFLLLAAVSIGNETGFLEALQQAAQNISEGAWKQALKTADIDPADHNLVDRLFLRFPVQRDIGLNSLLSICEELTQQISPRDPQFLDACIEAISEQLLEPKRAQTIVDLVLASYIPHIPVHSESEFIYCGIYPPETDELPALALDPYSNTPQIPTHSEPELIYCDVSSPETEELTPIALAPYSNTPQIPTHSESELIYCDVSPPETEELTPIAFDPHSNTPQIPTHSEPELIYCDVSSPETEELTPIALAPYSNSEMLDQEVVVLEADALDTVFEPKLTKIVGANNTQLNSSLMSCLNCSNIPYMDWTYYLSLPTFYEFPMCCYECGNPSIMNGYFCARPHYSYAKAELNHASSTLSACGISILGGTNLTDHWVLNGMLDFGRSSSSWDLEPHQTHEKTNHWSLASSIVLQYSKAYIQLMGLGAYNRSHVTHKEFDSIHLNHWNLGLRLDGAFYLRFPRESVQYIIQPYWCVDYFSVFQQNTSHTNLVSIKNAQFFDAKGLVKFFAEYFPSNGACLIPELSFGLCYADPLAQSAPQNLCDHAAQYHPWWAGIIHGGFSLFTKGNLVLKGIGDATISSSTQIYSANFTFGWSW